MTALYGRFLLRKLIVLLCLSSFMNVFRGHLAYAKKAQFTPRYQMALGLSLADQLSPSEQRQLPWRSLEQSALTPTRADLGFTYQAPRSNWVTELGLRLFRMNFEQHNRQIRPLIDPKGQGLALGELSLRYEPQSKYAPKVLLGHFLLSVEHSHWQHLADQRISALEYNAWRQEMPSYSLSVSPLDRFVLGASLSNTLKQHEYRLSVALPSSGSWSRLNLRDESGIIFDTAWGWQTKTFQTSVNLIYAHQLILQNSTLSYVDQQLALQTLKSQRVDLLGRELRRNELYLQANSTWNIGRLNRYQSKWNSSLGLRNSTITNHVLSAAEEASLAQTSLLGLGLNSRQSLAFYRLDHEQVPSNTARWPDIWRISYLWRDPHTQFAYDERHRSLVEFIYSGSNSSLSFWWMHLWNANANRWAVSNDVIGLSLEFYSLH